MSTDNINQNDIEQLEMQAKQMASLLDNNAQRLSMRTLKKLEDGRTRALDAYQHHQGATANADGTLNYWTAWVDHHRLAFAGFVLAAAIGGFMVLQNMDGNETSDAFLLGADLPPEAFVDLGFEPLLNKQVRI